MYDLQIEFPAPPISADADLRARRTHRRRGCRVAHAGPPSARRARRRARCRPRRSKRSAICFLNCYVNADNERLVAEHLRRELGVPVCISAEVSPQIREYPRMITTACNAATMPVIGPYLDELQKWLAGRGLRRVGADDALERRRRVGRRRGPDPDPPRRVRAGRRRARRLSGSPTGSARTACCASTWAAPRPRPASSSTASPTSRTRSRSPACTASRRARASRCRCRRSTSSRSAPAAESIAHTDHFGLLKVGPESAGAEPGPGVVRPRRHPTVGDRRRPRCSACSTPAGFLGGDMPLDLDAARPRARLASATRSVSTCSTPRRASTRSSTRTWPRRPGCTASSRASTCAASPCSPSAVPARCTPAVWPSCSSPTGSCSP